MADLLKGSWNEDRSYATVGLLFEHGVAPRRLAETHGVRGEVFGGQLVPSHALQKHGDVAVPVLLGTSQREAFVDDRAEGELVDETAEYAEHIH